MTVTRDKQEHRQRVRWGVTGLAAVFLVVMLGAAISRLGQENAATSTTNRTVPDAISEPNEPLAELGVAPSQAPSTNRLPGAASAEPTAP